MRKALQTLAGANNRFGVARGHLRRGGIGNIAVQSDGLVCGLRREDSLIRYLPASVFIGFRKRRAHRDPVALT